MDKRCFISEAEALSIANQALEDEEARRATVFASVKAALKARGLRYADLQLGSGPQSEQESKSKRAGRMADEIKRFARPLDDH